MRTQIVERINELRRAIPTLQEISRELLEEMNSADDYNEMSIKRRELHSMQEKLMDFKKEFNLLTQLRRLKGYSLLDITDEDEEGEE